LRAKRSNLLTLKGIAAVVSLPRHDFSPRFIPATLAKRKLKGQNSKVKTEGQKSKLPDMF